MRVAVVGHVEWVRFARVSHIPRAGEVAHAREPFEEPAGGGAVAAVQLARLAGSALLITALGEDEHGRRSRERLAELGVEVRAQAREAPTRSAVTLLDPTGERTITTFGERLEPSAAFVERELAAAVGRGGRCDGIYFTAGDEGGLRAAREASRLLTASPRAIHAFDARVELDALVLSADDEIERREAAPAAGHAQLLVTTEGEHGGSYLTRSGSAGRWQATPLDAPPRDSYGCGDSFAAALTFALARGMALEDALALAARCGAACLTGRGPYERQLTAAEL